MNADDGVFELPRANLGLRALAFVLDAALASASAWTLCFVFYIKWRYPGFVDDYAAFIETAQTFEDFANMPEDIAVPFQIANIAVGVGVFIYFFLCDWLWSGRTLGKRFVRLRAVRQAPFGAALSVRDAFLRTLVKSVCLSFLPLLFFNILSVFIGRERLALHDRAARTLVIDEMKFSEPSTHE